MTRFGLAALLMVATCTAQNRSELITKGEQVFAKSCATGYCHGPQGASGGLHGWRGEASIRTTSLLWSHAAYRIPACNPSRQRCHERIWWR